MMRHEESSEGETETSGEVEPWALGGDQPEPEPTNEPQPDVARVV
jgi:hypothetical protein